MSTPRFSVIVPTLNRARELPVAVRSVLGQTGTDFELIIVDDGSTDDTESVVAGFADARIRYHRQPRSGVSPARNAGAASAKGDLLIFLDSDDELLPGALARYDEAARANGWDVVVASRVWVSADRRDWHTRIPRALAFLSGGFALSKEVFLSVGGYDADLGYGENTELGWRVRQWLTENGRGIGIVEEPAVVLYKQPARGYDVARYESARRILEHPDQVLEWESVGTVKPSRRRSTYRAIVAVNAAKLGRRREAVRFAAGAIASDPLSWRRYRNALHVFRELSRRQRPESTGAPARSAAPVSSEGRPARGAIHGVLVTFNRAESLARMVEEVSHIGLDSLTVVDNAPSATSEAAARVAGDRLCTAYIGMPENSGPAGGIATGMTRVLESAADEDWILILDDDRLTGPGDTARTLRDFGEFLAARGARVGAVGQVGARFDRRRGRLVRLPDNELAGPVRVDYVAGGQMLTLRVAAAREIGVFDPALFFGFDDLDYCERLRRRGYGVYVYGPAALAARHRFGRLGENVGPPPRRENAWRRYYSVRNHIVIMRRYTSTPRAMFVTVAQLFGRPVLDVARGNGDVRVILATIRGCADAWTGRLGRTMEPPLSS
jgi:glycosyltransferase involved in cell wall biosynthesis